MPVLDLDNKKTWNRKFIDLVDKKMDQIDRFSNNEIQARRFICEIKNTPENQHNETIRELFGLGICIFLNHYSHLIAYHRTRVENIKSIKTYGLFVRNSEKIFKEASKVYPDIKSEKDRIFKKLREVGKLDVDGKVWFFVSKHQAISGNGFCFGGEHFGNIIGEYNYDEKEKIRNFGNDVIVKVKLDLKWDEMRDAIEIYAVYVSDVLSEIVRSRILPNEKRQWFEQGISINRNIDPYNIAGIKENFK